MDFLFSIPFFFYFFSGPTVWSSIATSLNFLFFYMTWSTLVLTNHAWQIHLAGVLVIRVVIFLIPSLITLAFDLLLPSLAKRIKHGGARSLPPRDAAKIASVVLWAVFHLLFLTAVEGVCASAYDRALRQYPFRASILLPAPFVIFKHIAWMYLIRGLAQYFVHRDVLHSRRSVHARQHIKASHGHHLTSGGGGGAPYSILAYNDHPVPLLLHRLLPMFGSAIVVGPHMTTYFLFVFICTLEETLSMSGYTAVPGFVMSGVTRRTAEHYMFGGDGNFGTLGLMDWLLDTGIGKDVVDDVRDELETHHVKERATKRLESGLSKVRDAVDGELETRRTTRRRNTRSSS